ncbi:MAG TPA: hypothetical protein VKW77_09925, partial [Acidimicrobiales bacterium]|nr:hypothetical protein [Acidimicrobiales bacterium]
LPVVIVSDAVQVLAAPWRRPQGRGRFETVPTAAAGGSVAGESRRAVATALVSSTPGSYVLDVDPETGDMLVHRLASRGPRIDHLVTS